MCRSSVSAEATPVLVDLLRDMVSALAPDDPESVIIGPCDFGGRE